MDYDNSQDFDRYLVKTVKEAEKNGGMSEEQRNFLLHATCVQGRREEDAFNNRMLGCFGVAGAIALGLLLYTYYIQPKIFPAKPVSQTSIQPLKTPSPLIQRENVK